MLTAILARCPPRHMTIYSNPETASTGVMRPSHARARLARTKNKIDPHLGTHQEDDRSCKNDPDEKDTGVHGNIRPEWLIRRKILS